jgi:hypothetical protein
MEEGGGKYDAEKSLHEVHLSVLPSQGSVYTSCQVPGEKGVCTAKMLVGALAKNFKSLSFANPPDVEIKEMMYAYLPQGCEIISIDVFKSFDPKRQLMTGITWTTAAEEDDHSVSYYFNTYESLLDMETINCIDSIELEFVPYQLTHVDFEKNEEAFIISGSDLKCHVFFYDKDNNSYAEAADEFVDEYFPELMEQSPSVALWVDFIYLHSHKKRLTAMGHECGKIILYVVDVDDSEILSKHVADLEGPISRVEFFQTKILPVPAEIQRYMSDDAKLARESVLPTVRLLALSSVLPSVVYYDMETRGLGQSVTLDQSDEYDVATCASMADIDLDGR